MNKKHQEIISIYNKQYLVHPSYQEIADQVDRSKSVVAKVIQEYLRQSELFKLKNK